LWTFREKLSSLHLLGDARGYHPDAGRTSRPDEASHMVPKDSGLILKRVRFKPRNSVRALEKTYVGIPNDRSAQHTYSGKPNEDTREAYPLHRYPTQRKQEDRKDAKLNGAAKSLLATKERGDDSPYHTDKDRACEEYGSRGKPLHAR
jgi:hypothetical protein